MIDRLLKAKHWHLFALTFGIPFLCQLVFMLRMASSINDTSAPDPSAVAGSMMIYPLISILYTVVLFGWFWAVGTGLNNKIPKSIPMKLGRFKLFLLIPVLYIIFIFFFLTFTFSNVLRGGDFNPLILGIIIPLHLFAMFCIFYCLYFIAKTIKTAEMQNEQRFSDFVGEFFLIWFFPIGIWFIQPRVNKLFETSFDNDIEQHLVP